MGGTAALRASDALGGGGQWYTLAVNDQVLMVIDRSALGRPRSRQSVQEVQIFAKAHPVGNAPAPARRLEIQLDIDCAARHFRPRHFQTRDESGQPLAEWDADAQQAQWQAPTAGSANFFLLQAVCRRHFDAQRSRPQSDLQQLQRLYVAATSGH